MWIIAKNLPIYPSAQATGGLILDSNELSDQLAQSVMWRSKPSSSKTWLRRLKRKSSTPRLFSQTLKPSLGNTLVDEWTSSVEGFLVNHLVPQEEGAEMKIPDTCGHTLSMESNGLEDLPLFSSRTWRESSAQSSRVTNGQTPKEHPFCFMSIESWKDWVTEQRQAYSQRLKLAQHTEEKGSLFSVSEMTSQTKVGNGSLKAWATPRASKIGSENLEKWKKRAEKGQVSTMPLGLQVEVSEQHTPHQGEQSNTPMSHQELNWATPNTMDHLSPKSAETLMRQATTVRKGRKYPSNLREQVDPKSMQIYKETNWATPTSRDWKGAYSEEGLILNPKWVALLPDQVKENQKMWTTPISRDCYEIEMKQQIPNRKDGKTRLDTMPRQIHHQEGYKGKLNPRWVEMLMGLPIGWTMPSCTNPVIVELTSLGCWETELYLTPPKEPSQFCGKSYVEEDINDSNTNQ